VHPKLAARSPVHRAVRAAQEKDIQWFMARPTVRERTRPATLAEQRLCWNLYGMPVTEIRVWLERVKVKYEGWSDTFRWTAR
jgi:hypothetical protein